MRQEVDGGGAKGARPGRPDEIVGPGGDGEAGDVAEKAVGRKKQMLVISKGAKKAQK